MIFNAWKSLSDGLSLCSANRVVVQSHHPGPDCLRELESPALWLKELTSIDFRAPIRCETHDFTIFFASLRHVAASHAFLSCRIFVALFLRNYNWYLFSSAMINEGSRSIISDGWKLHDFAATGRVISGGYPAIFQDVSLIEISPEWVWRWVRGEVRNIIRYGTVFHSRLHYFLSSSAQTWIFQFCEDFICTQAFGQQILQLLDLATVLAVPFFLLLCQYALKSVLLPLAPVVGLYLQVYVICGKR